MNTSINIWALLLSWILFIAMQIVNMLLESDPQKKTNRLTTETVMTLYFPFMVILAFFLSNAIG